MPIDYGSNNVSTSGNFVASSGNFTTALTVNGVPVATGVGGGGTTISNAADNRILTSDGTSTGINAETNLTFNGTTLGVTGTIDIDNLRLDANTISSTNTNGSISITPNGTGQVALLSDVVRCGDPNVAATITTNGTGNLVLNTNSNTNSGSITIQQGSNNDIILEPNGTGQIQASSTGNSRGQYAIDWQRVRSVTSRVASGNYSVIGGGLNNTASGSVSVIAGGGANTASGYQSAICGGAANTASGTANFVGGGSSNTNNGSYCTIGGGLTNVTSSTYGTVGGGLGNLCYTSRSTIAGGQSNIISIGDYGIIGGGLSNQIANGSFSSILGGFFNYTNSAHNVICGGSYNTTNGEFSTITGGKDAIASLYGEEARSSGKFNTQQDAQIRKFILRVKTSPELGTSGVPLRLDGYSSQPFPGASNTILAIPENCSWFFTIKIVARDSNNVESAAYQFDGLLERNSLTTIILQENKTVIYEDNANWDASIVVTTDHFGIPYLDIRFTSDSGQYNVYCVAYTEVVQVIVPSAVPSYS